MGPPFVKWAKGDGPTLGGAVFEKINRDHDRDGGDPSRSQLSCGDADSSHYRSVGASRDRNADSSL